MDFLIEPFRTGLAFVLVLGVLVFIHELGHYLAARSVNVHVDVFSIGFGRAIAGWTGRTGTVWKIGWIPLGGYVKLHGQERPEEADAETAANWREGQTFHQKSVGARAWIVAAGPLANFLLAAVLFAALYGTMGRPSTTSVVGEVVAESAAARAGLMAGDRIVAVDGTAISRFEELQRIVAGRPGQTVVIEVARDATRLPLTATIDAREMPDGSRAGVLGIRGGQAAFERLGPVSAMGAGIAQTWNVAAETVSVVGQMITGQRGADDLGGPLRIAQLSGQVAEIGIGALITFMAVLSVNLGLINLFPIPVLDGGHLMFYAAEAIRGRPLSPRAQEIGFRAGFALLIALFVFVTFNDLSSLGVVRWVTGLVG